MSLFDAALMELVPAVTDLEFGFLPPSLMDYSRQLFNVFPPPFFLPYTPPFVFDPDLYSP